MRISAHHVRNFISMTNEIETLRNKALQLHDQQEGYKFTPDDPKTFHGPMSAEQLERVIPGFIRVEVLSIGAASQHQLDPIPVAPGVKIDTSVCCSNNATPEKQLRPIKPRSEDIVLWETTIRALGVRQFPEPIGWAGLLVGVNPHNKNAHIGSFWSGEDGAFGKDSKRPGRDGTLFGQQAGFMATRVQIEYFHSVCPGGFLPPFDSNAWTGNGKCK